MNITKLEISGYKNLNIKLEHDAKVISLIGNNGSGKSNILEALSIIFRDLYLEKNNTPFNYKIEYIIRSETVVIEKNHSSIKYLVNNNDVASILRHLPNKVVAIYSGEADRLWKESYEIFYKNTIKSIYKESLVTMPKLLLINKYYWQLSLLTLLLSNNEDDKIFVREKLGIHTINKIKFTINKTNYKNYPDSLALNLAKAIEHQDEYTLGELKETLSEFTELRDVYSYLYILFTPKNNKIIEEITILFNDKRLTIDSLSEGEKKLLLLKSAFEFAVQEDSLFLLDEPDAHIHVNNKEQIIKLIEPFKENRQVILTTHSPTVTKSISNDELFMMDNGELIDKQEQEILDHLTGDFWNRHQQSSFLSSDKKIILLVEGRHDKVHLTNAFAKLRDDFNNLDFDIFSLGGESKIRPFMIGLYETNVWKDKVYIAIYDNDTAGITSLKKGWNDKESCNYKKLVDDKLKHDNFFAISLIKPQGFTDDCTIESMFEPQKYQNAYASAMQNYKYFSNRSIEKINKEIKDESKNLLAEQSNSFSKDDFKYFKPLFQLINQIQKDSSPIPHEIIENVQPIDVQGNDESTNSPSPELTEVFYKGAIGLYNPESNHLILKAGSQIRKDYIPSFSEADKAKREHTKSEIGVENDGNTLKTLTDYEFDSPSAAGKFVFCSNVNGREVWENTDGISLNELYPKPLEN